MGDKKGIFRIFAPNGKYVNLFHEGRMWFFRHGELVELERDMAEKFSGIFFEVENTAKKVAKKVKKEAEKVAEEVKENAIKDMHPNENKKE